jgi:hypothetical protein
MHIVFSVSQWCVDYLSQDIDSHVVGSLGGVNRWQEVIIRLDRSFYQSGCYGGQKSYDRSLIADFIVGPSQWAVSWIFGAFQVLNNKFV